MLVHFLLRRVSSSILPCHTLEKVFVDHIFLAIMTTQSHHPLSDLMSWLNNIFPFGKPLFLFLPCIVYLPSFLSKLFLDGKLSYLLLSKNKHMKTMVLGCSILHSFVTNTTYTKTYECQLVRPYYASSLLIGAPDQFPNIQCLHGFQASRCGTLSTELLGMVDVFSNVPNGVLQN